MTHIRFQLNDPSLTDVQVSELLKLNRMPTYDGLFHDQFMIGTMDKGIVSIRKEFVPGHLHMLLMIAKQLP